MLYYTKVNVDYKFCQLNATAASYFDNVAFVVFLAIFLDVEGNL
jgi:hypothetical protein